VTLIEVDFHFRHNTIEIRVLYQRSVIRMSHLWQTTLFTDPGTQT